MYFPLPNSALVSNAIKFHIVLRKSFLFSFFATAHERVRVTTLLWKKKAVVCRIFFYWLCWFELVHVRISNKSLTLQVVRQLVKLCYMVSCFCRRKSRGWDDSKCGTENKIICKDLRLVVLILIFNLSQ